MKRNYRLNGLDCANCGAKLENKISKIKGVNEVSISFMTLKMVIDIDDNDFDNVFCEVERVIAKFEPDIKLTRC